MASIDAIVWSDFLCPWCYVGLDRSALLRSLGVEVTTLPFELHPDIPPGGVPIAPGRYARVAALAADAGMPFRSPARAFNSRPVLAAAELVRQSWPDLFPVLERALFTAYFVDGDDLGDPAVVDAHVADAGADAAAVREAVTAGIVDEALTASRAAAVERGVTGTPAWLLAGRLVVPGVQDRSFYERVVVRLRDQGVT